MTKPKDPTLEAISNGCLWVLFWLAAILAISVTAGLSARIFLAISGMG